MPLTCEPGHGAANVGVPAGQPCNSMIVLRFAKQLNLARTLLKGLVTSGCTPGFLLLRLIARSAGASLLPLLVLAASLEASF